MDSIIAFAFDHLVGTISLLIIIYYLVTFFVKLYRARTAFNGLPKPPHSFLLGNLPAMGKLMAKLPSNVHPHVIIHYLRKEYNLPAVFYLDTWPIGELVCAIVDAGAAQQITVQRPLSKHPAMVSALWPVTGHNALILIGGQEHKKWRAIFNPGFQSGHLMTLVSGIVDDALVFVEVLAKHAKAQDVFIFEEVATRVTVDIIGRVVLGVPLRSQTTENEFVTTFRNSMAWLEKSNNNTNPLMWFNPIRSFVYERNRRAMHKFLGDVMNDRFIKGYENQSKDKKKHARPIIDLAFDAYMKDYGGARSTKTLDPAFKEAAMDHIKTFMFAGHDTTSSTICYMVHAMAEHPEALEKVLQEYDEVFGPDVTQTAARIKEDPYLLNQLPYTTAIMKEALRLWPPASGVRQGEPGVYINHDGKQYPTEGFMAWPAVHAIHHSSDLWPEPFSFIPERWLAKEGDPLFPVKGAWRPFEHGSRGCIGQELATIETKIIMALMLRQFKIAPAYAEPGPKGPKGETLTTPEGERAYQVLVVTGKPVDGYPARVSWR